MQLVSENRSGREVDSGQDRKSRQPTTSGWEETEKVMKLATYTWENLLDAVARSSPSSSAASGWQTGRGVVAFRGVGGGVNVVTP